MWKLLQQRKGSTIQPDEINDITSGKKYHELGSFTCEPTNVTNTDGVQLFKSSAVSMWPIWVIINELPPALRYVLY